MSEKIQKYTDSDVDTSVMTRPQLQVVTVMAGGESGERRRAAVKNRHSDSLFYTFQHNIIQESLRTLRHAHTDMVLGNDRKGTMFQIWHWERFYIHWVDRNDTSVREYEVVF